MVHHSCIVKDRAVKNLWKMTQEVKLPQWWCTRVVNGTIPNGATELGLGLRPQTNKYICLPFQHKNLQTWNSIICEIQQRLHSAKPWEWHHLKHWRLKQYFLQIRCQVKCIHLESYGVNLHYWILDLLILCLPHCCSLDEHNIFDFIVWDLENNLPNSKSHLEALFKPNLDDS